MTGPREARAAQGAGRGAGLALLPARHLLRALLLGALSLVPAALHAQVKPNDGWRTLRTPHFAIHFTPPLEETARRAAVSAERAYAQLAAELVPPRGTVELVIADNVDFTNGYATPVPSNRIVIYAQPPVSELSLRLYDDWTALVITHELTHIFHLDRSRGWWRAAQYVFGRNPALFPNAYAPSWLTEGLAVYYESRLTGYGRLVGSEHRMLARAGVLEERLPRIDELSLATPRFPQGQVAYAYGSLLIDYLARTRGPEHVRDFLERTSAQPLPFFYNAAARRGFGVSFRRAWRAWRDSLRVEVGTSQGLSGTAPIPGWRDLTHGGWYALHPRWSDTATIVFAGNSGRATPAAYRVPAEGGRLRRLGRRNGVEPNVPLPDGGLLFAQLEFTSPYEIRSDLYVERAGREHRLTRGARLSSPDARLADGAIVAVQATPATTRLVRVSSDGRTIAALTTTSPDTQWAEPRWAPDGRHVAATRIASSGLSDVVVLDTAGAVVQVVAPRRSVESSPAWSADGSRLLFTSDRGGTTDVYEARFTDTTTTGEVRRLSAAATGVFHPAPSPDARTLAAAIFRADGYHVGRAPYDTTWRAPETVAERGVLPPPARPPVADSQALLGARAARYAPWRTLLPRYWLPVLGTTDEDALALGAFTSGEDVIGRHAYAAQFSLAPQRSAEVDASLSYRYAGFGQPLLDVGLRQAWEHGDIGTGVEGEPRAGVLSQNTRTASVAATLLRPRMRTNGSLSVGTAIDVREFSTDPAPLLSQIPSFFRERHLYPSLFASAGWGNTQRPALSISPEDGVSLAVSARQRWLSGGSPDQRARTAAVVARGFKSLDLPGFAHHVLALRLAGFVGSSGADAEGAGGTSGGSVELLPGFPVGGGPRLLGVRGFPSDALRGLRAVGGSLEYRAPLTMPARGLGLLPVFLARTSVSAFADAASAWCPASYEGRAFDCAPADFERETIASVGAELNVDAALQYDVPYRFRVGIATPVVGRDLFDRRGVAGYATVGLSF